MGGHEGGVYWGGEHGEGCSREGCVEEGCMGRSVSGGVHGEGCMGCVGRGAWGSSAWRRVYGEGCMGEECIGRGEWGRGAWGRDGVPYSHKKRKRRKGRNDQSAISGHHHRGLEGVGKGRVRGHAGEVWRPLLDKEKDHLKEIKKVSSKQISFEELEGGMN